MAVHILSRVETGRSPYWRGAALAGVFAGLVFLVLELVLVGLFTPSSAWAPMRMIAAIMLGTGVLPPPETLTLPVLFAAAVVHFLLAIFYGLVIGYLVFRLEMEWAVLAGAVLGLLLYWLNFYGFTDIFPWFAMARNWISVLAHILFGLTAAWFYKGLAGRHLRRETIRA